jgi:proteasome lid subunit RPN8/RPN11
MIYPVTQRQPIPVRAKEPLPTHLPILNEKTPSCPTFPAEWSQQIAFEAWVHCNEVYPKEAVAIVKGGEYIRLENLSKTPENDIALSDEQLLMVAQADIFFHSHPDGLACPSEMDMRYQQQLGIPFVIMCLPIYDVFCWGDMLQDAPIEGRTFRHGIHDCCTVIRDWYKVQHGVTFPHAPRGWSWWSKTKQNLYLDNFKASGFVQIPFNEATFGDVVLFQWNYRVPMHAALIIDQFMMLHHAAGVRELDRSRLSCQVPRGRYNQHVMVTLRYDK